MQFLELPLPNPLTPSNSAPSARVLSSTSLGHQPIKPGYNSSYDSSSFARLYTSFGNFSWPLISLGKSNLSIGVQCGMAAHVGHRNGIPEST